MRRNLEFPSQNPTGWVAQVPRILPVPVPVAPPVSRDVVAFLQQVFVGPDAGRAQLYTNLFAASGYGTMAALRTLTEERLLALGNAGGRACVLAGHRALLLAKLAELEPAIAAPSSPTSQASDEPEELPQRGQAALKELHRRGQIDALQLAQLLQVERRACGFRETAKDRAVLHSQLRRGQIGYDAYLKLYLQQVYKDQAFEHVYTPGRGAMPKHGGRKKTRADCNVCLKNVDTATDPSVPNPSWLQTICKEWLQDQKAPLALQKLVFKVQEQSRRGRDGRPCRLIKGYVFVKVADPDTFIDWVNERGLRVQPNTESILEAKTVNTQL